MHARRIVGPLFLLLMAGCAGVEAPSPAVESPAAMPETVEPSAPAADEQQPVARTEPPAAAPAVKLPVQPPAIKPVAKPAPAKQEAVPAKQESPPPLDLTTLETRLKETKAIGVFTKLTLKNQVDDLLDQFRAYYQGRAKTSLAELRRPYDGLVLKVLSLLQDGDPELARAIVTSREAIWGILADPNKFATI